MKTGQTGMLVAGMLLALVIGWTLHTAMRVPAQSRLWQQRQHEVRELALMGDTQRSWEHMVAALDSLMEGPFTDIRALLRDQFPGLRVDSQLEHAGPAWPGWQLERYQVRMDSVPMDALDPILTLLESQRPPWRLTRIQLEALDREFDQVRLIFAIEGIRPEL